MDNVQRDLTRYWLDLNGEKHYVELGKHHNDIASTIIKEDEFLRSLYAQVYDELYPYQLLVYIGFVMVVDSPKVKTIGYCKKSIRRYKKRLFGKSGVPRF